MELDWNPIIEIVVGGLILAMTVGVGALAWRDWQAFSRLFGRLLISTFAIGLACAAVYGIWTDTNNTEIREQVISLVDAGHIQEQDIVRLVELNRRLLDYLLYWVLLPICVSWLYLAAIYLFARPIPEKPSKEDQDLLSHQRQIETSQEKIEALEKETEKEKARLSELSATVPPLQGSAGKKHTEESDSPADHDAD